MKRISEREKSYLEAAAAEVERQVMENPGVPIPIDPDVAEYMGLGVEDAISYEDALEAAQHPEDD